MTTNSDSLSGVPSSAIRGIALLLIAFIIFTVQDVIVKLISGDYALLQIVLIRTLFTLPIVFGILYFNGGFRLLRTNTLGMELLRGAAMFFAYVFFFMALTALPYATNQAIFFSGPLFMTMLSIPMLGEAVGWRRWLAVVFGFVGVLIVVDPRGANYDPATLYALAAALCYAFSIVATRKMDDSAPVITVYTAGVYLLGALILSPILATLDSTSAHPSIEFLMRAWPPVPARDVLLIAGLAVCWGTGMVLLSTAYSITPVAVLAPFEYFGIVYGLIAGFLIWRDVPTLQMVIGMVLIVVSGLFILYRENQADKETAMEQ